jgi:hypothetical protein
MIISYSNDSFLAIKWSFKSNILGHMIMDFFAILLFNHPNVFRLVFSWYTTVTYGNNIWTGYLTFSLWES